MFFSCPEDDLDEVNSDPDIEDDDDTAMPWDLMLGYDLDGDDEEDDDE